MWQRAAEALDRARERGLRDPPSPSRRYPQRAVAQHLEVGHLAVDGGEPRGMSSAKDRYLVSAISGRAQASARPALRQRGPEAGAVLKQRRGERPPSLKGVRRARAAERRSACRAAARAAPSAGGGPAAARTRRRSHHRRRRASQSALPVLQRRESSFVDQVDAGRTACRRAGRESHRRPGRSAPGLPRRRRRQAGPPARPRGSRGPPSRRCGRALQRRPAPTCCAVDGWVAGCGGRRGRLPDGSRLRPWCVRRGRAGGGAHAVAGPRAPAGLEATRSVTGQDVVAHQFNDLAHCSRPPTTGMGQAGGGANDRQTATCQCHPPGSWPPSSGLLQLWTAPA